ncbi:integrase, catalytic region, zinc finger, CCHC-type containing protein [Tanacetum coccineum]
MQALYVWKIKVRIPPPDYSKENLLATFAPQRNLTPKQIFWSIDDNNRKKAETSVLKPISALTVYPPNTPVKLNPPRILPTKSQVKINLYVLTQLFTEFDKTCKTRITPTGVTEGERGFEQTKRCYLTEVIPFFKTLKEHFIGVQTALFKEVKEMEEIFDQMNNEVDKNTVDKQCAEIVKKNLLIENENLIANCLSTQLLHDVQKSRCLDLEADMSKVHNESKHVSKLEREYLNLQLKYQHLQESFDNKNSQTSQEAPDFNSFFKIKNLEHQIQEKDNVIRDLKVLVANLHLKESVETVREIVEEARVVKPLDNALYYACQYTKLSQELLEYVIGTCPKGFNERDNKAPSTPVTRKKQVTFSDKPGTSSSNTQKHEVHQKVQQTNIPVIPSTGVNASTEASGSKPRSNTKKNRILPAKKENMKKVEVHLRTNKSVWTKVNRIDSSISYKRVVINSNSESVCKMCDKCLNSANHEKCVVNILSSVNATPTVKRVLNKGKQIWKPKGKLSDNSSSELVRFGNDSLRAFMGYGDYVIVTLLQKDTCFVRDINGADILKGSRSTNLYTISIDEMMKSSPICCPKLPSVGIFHQKSVLRTPQQNGVVERRNHTLVEAARTILIFSKAPMFLWAAAIATALFGALCYPTNDSEDLGKFQAKADIGIFVGYAPSRKGYRIYNKRTCRLMKTIHVTFDEMHPTMAPVRMSSGPEPIIMTPGQLKSGLAPTDKEL